MLLHIIVVQIQRLKPDLAINPTLYNYIVSLLICFILFLKYFSGIHFHNNIIIYLTVVGDRKHNEIGPNIANSRIILATNNHNVPYVYNP